MLGFIIVVLAGIQQRIKLDLLCHEPLGIRLLSLGIAVATVLVVLDFELFIL